MLAGHRYHAVAAGHEAGRRRQRHPAGIFKRLARLEGRFLADHARTLDLLQPPESVGDAPMARLELHRLGSQIGDVDGVGPEVIAVAGRRALRNEAGRHRDFDLAGYGPVHLNALQFYEAWASYFRPACGLWPKDHTKEKPALASNAPTINPIPNPPAIPEDSGSHFVNLSGISDADGNTQTITITATSNNVAL